MIPFPREEVTPPVTNMYLVIRIGKSFIVTGLKGTEKKRISETLAPEKRTCRSIVYFSQECLILAFLNTIKYENFPKEIS